jgi:hypothetical protein
MLPTDGAKSLLDNLNRQPKITYQDLINDDKQSDVTRDFLQIMVLLYEEIYQGIELLDLRYEAAQSKARLIRQYVKTKKTELAQLMRQTGVSSEQLEQAKHLDKLLNSIKEQING